MGVEFYNAEGKELLFSITDAEVAAMDKVIDMFNDRYDGLIDIYGTFRLYPNHIAVLNDLIAMQELSVRKGFKDMITLCLTDNITLTVEGD